LIDKVAYTWFNRFVALRFMDVNDYQPLGVKILSSLQGYTTPEILDDAKRGNLNEELQVDRRKIGDLLDGRIPSSNAQNEVYKLLLTGVCNHLHKTFPFLFERIDDYTELLLPDDLTSEFSIIQDIRNGMSKEDCKEVETIGWLYQFYISEKKDEVFASKDKVKKEDIPAATQLFTPRWIVEYMVQNTVGKLWLLNNPTSRLKDQMPYYIESAEKDDDFLKIDSVEEITLLDQACGSGHILVYGFELLTKIYEEQGYNTSEIPQLIINKNLFGFEIDERAAQLSGFALLMKAREYNRRVFRKELKPNILCYKDLKLTEEEIKETFTQLKIELTDELLFDLKNIQQATNLGSLISPHSDTTSIQAVIDKVISSKSSSDVFLRYRLEELEVSLEHLLLLSNKYHCVVDNPPYLNAGKMNKELSNFVKLNYPNTRSDIMGAFIESGLNSIRKGGFLGMINQQTWMFIGKFTNFRNWLIKNIQIDSLLQLGARTFPEIGGEVVQSSSFVLGKYFPNHDGSYFNLTDESSTEKKKKAFLNKIIKREFFNIPQNIFSTLPNSILGYWVSSSIRKCFSEMESIDSYWTPKQGMATSNNDRFLRYWPEVSNNSSGYGFSSRNDAKKSNKKWFPYNKGGQFRKWYGNNDLLVNWENDGHEIKEFREYKNSVLDSNMGVAGLTDFFKQSISWSLISDSSSFSIRFVPKGSLFDVNGLSIFPNNYSESYYLMGFMNSKVSSAFLKILNPSLAVQAGDVKKLPLPSTFSNNLHSINKIVENCIELSNMESSINETTSTFNQHELIRIKGQDLQEIYFLYQHYWENKFNQLHTNEEELNRQFIDIYGLKNELTPDVRLEKITLLKKETSIVNGELVFDQNEVFSQFISYAVGCMFGRYSLDKEGLILANQGETLKDYLSKVDKQESELSFVPDDDNIIPILDDEWFEDDIVGRFYAFLKASFGEQNFEKNLSFVEESIGKDIRKYFVKDFYKDHIKRYKKRPIYWMFSSPKGSFNVLVYMHRYTPDTLNQVLNGYLNEYREKLKTRIETLDHLMVSGSPSEQNKASKEKDKIQLILLELQEYEREILYPLATERISIDLDDGVLVNYNKFGKAIATVAGLNDKKAKEKVRKFDWIDTTTIR